MAAERPSPTVIVSRTVPRESEDEFAAWIARLVNAAYRHPGYLDSFVERPTEGHPGEWTVVDRFTDQQALDGWLGSDERTGLLEEGRHLIHGEAREQVLAGVASDGEARVVSSYRLLPGSDGRHLMVHKRMLDALQQFDGFLGREILDPVAGIQDETIVILTFDTAHHLRQWIESDERAKILADLDAITVGSLKTNVVGGFAGWFPAGSDGREPRKWKQALLILVALFPVSLAVSALRSWIAPDLPLVPSVLIGNIIGIAVLTWFVMPPLTARFADWLRQ